LQHRSKVYTNKYEVLINFKNPYFINVLNNMQNTYIIIHSIYKVNNQNKIKMLYNIQQQHIIYITLKTQGNEDIKMPYLRLYF
jgi:hypothetical protein